MFRHVLHATLATVALAVGIAKPASADADAARALADDDIVVQFTTGGGFTGPCCSFWDLPEITVYADGTAILTDRGDGQVPDATVAVLERSEVEAILAAARDAGLFGTPDGGPLCCDLAYTRVVLVDGDAAADFQVMGLGLEGEVADSGLTAEQLEVRAAVADVEQQIRDLVSGDDDATRYTPEELALWVFPGHSQPDDEPRPWPLDQPLSEAGRPLGESGRCVHVTGSDATAVLDAASTADSGSWTSGGEEWTVGVRPLLPHEHACPDDAERAAQRAELAEQRARWEAAGVSDYSFVVAAHCFCPTEYTTPRTVTVAGGSVSAVDPELPSGWTMPLTVDDLFALVERGLDEGAFVGVGYDAEYGFPTSVFVDWEELIVDEESAFEVTEFQPAG